MICAFSCVYNAGCMVHGKHLYNGRMPVRLSRRSIASMLQRRALVQLVCCSSISIDSWRRRPSCDCGERHAVIQGMRVEADCAPHDKLCYRFLCLPYTSQSSHPFLINSQQNRSICSIINERQQIESFS